MMTSYRRARCNVWSSMSHRLLLSENNASHAFDFYSDLLSHLISSLFLSPLIFPHLSPSFSNPFLTITKRTPTRWINDKIDESSDIRGKSNGRMFVVVQRDEQVRTMISSWTAKACTLVRPLGILLNPRIITGRLTSRTDTTPDYTTQIFFDAIKGTIVWNLENGEPRGEKSCAFIEKDNITLFFPEMNGAVNIRKATFVRPLVEWDPAISDLAISYHSWTRGSLSFSLSTLLHSYLLMFLVSNKLSEKYSAGKLRQIRLV